MAWQNTWMSTLLPPSAPPVPLGHILTLLGSGMQSQPWKFANHLAPARLGGPREHKHHQIPSCCHPREENNHHQQLWHRGTIPRGQESAAQPTVPSRGDLVASGCCSGGGTELGK